MRNDLLNSWTRGISVMNDFGRWDTRIPDRLYEDFEARMEEAKQGYDAVIIVLSRRQNHWMDNPPENGDKFHQHLLDKGFKVVQIHSPMHNNELVELYAKLLVPKCTKIQLVESEVNARHNCYEGTRPMTGGFPNSCAASSVAPPFDEKSSKYIYKSEHFGGGACIMPFVEGSLPYEAIVREGGFEPLVCDETGVGVWIGFNRPVQGPRAPARVHINNDDFPDQDEV